MSALTEREEERHATRPVAILPVGRSVNREFQTIAAGGREEDDDDGGGGRGEGGLDGRGGRIAFNRTTTMIAAVSSAGRHAPGRRRRQM